MSKGIVQVLDLRAAHELEGEPAADQEESLRYVRIPLIRAPRTVDDRLASYRFVLDNNGTQIGSAVLALLNPAGLPALIGCGVGKDRTGLTIAVILSSLGVMHDAIVADYSWPCCARAPMYARRSPETMIRALAYLKHRYGGPRGYLLRHGVPGSHLRALGAYLLEPAISPGEGTSMESHAHPSLPHDVGL